MNGPTQIVIPEQRYLSCKGCDHYSHVMLKSGFNPIYAEFCSNSDIPETYKRMSPLNWRGNLMNDKTPDWCPFLTKKVEEKHEPLTHCHADRDGDCYHPDCPQIRDDEPKTSGRSCPLYNWDDE